GGEFSSNLLRDFCRGEGILKSFTLPDSPQQNRIVERRIGLVMEVVRTSMIHAAAPHFLWSFAVRYAAHQLNLWPRVSLPKTSPTLRWTGEVGDASADKLSPRAIPCVFLGFVPDAPGKQFYHPTSRCVFHSQDVTCDESVPFYRLFPYSSAPPPPPPLFLAPGPPPVAVGSGAARGVASGGAAAGSAEFEGAETGVAEPGGLETGVGEPGGAEPEGAPSRSTLRLLLVRGAASARASGARELEEVVGTAVVAVEAEEGVGVEVVVEVGALVAAVAMAGGVEEAEAAAAEVELAEAEMCSRDPSSSSALVRPLRPNSFVSGMWGARGLGFPDASEIPRWGDLLRSGVAIFDLDLDAILAAMYAMSISAEVDCYVCVPPDPGIEAAALGASESAALGTRESAALGAGEYALSGTESAQVFHTFTLDSGASRSFFRDRTTLTPLSRPVAVSLADPSGGPVLARYSTVLPCPAAPSGSLSGLYLPSFSTNLVSGADLQDAGVDQFTPAGQRVTHYTCAQTGRHLASFTRRLGSSLYTLTTESPPVAASGQVAASSQVFAAASRSGPESAPCSCRLLSHQTLLWHHRLGHPSLPHLRGMASRVLVSGLPRSLPPLPPGPAPTCVPCVEGRQRAAPHSSEFPPTEAPLQTLHMDVWGLARVCGQGHERYFLLVVDDYSRYTTVFPLRSKGEVTETFTLPASPHKNGIAERRIGMVMDVARTSMIHAAAPHFLWPFAVQNAAHQINLQPRVSLQETSPTLQWTGKVGDASAFRVWDLKLSSETCLQTSCPPVLFLASSSAFPLTGLGPAPSGVSQVDAVEPVEVAADSGASGGRAEPWGAASGGAKPGVAGSGGVEPAGAGPGGPAGALSRRELPSPQELREWFARRWSRAAVGGGAAGAGGSAAAGGPGAGGAAGAGTGGSASAGGAGATGPGGARTGGTGAAGPGGAPCAGATGGAGAGGAAGVGATRGTGARATVFAGVPAGAVAAGGTGASGAVGVGADAGGPGVVPAGSGGAARPRPYFVPLLEPVLGLLPSSNPPPSLECPPPVQSESQLQLVSPLPAPSPYAGPTGGLAERREPKLCPASLVRTSHTSRRVPRLRPPAVPGTHQMALRPSTAPQRVPLPSPQESSLPALADPSSDSLRAASPTFTRFLATVVTDPSFESTAASALVAELVDFTAHCRLDYAASLVAESASVCPPSVGGECALSTDVLEDRQEEFQCFATALPHLVSTLLAPEGDPDAPDIPTPRSYAEAIEGPYSSQWQSQEFLQARFSCEWGLPASCLCEAEIYADAMAAQELRWLTYLLTHLGEPPRSPPVLYIDYKAMLALCREHRLEHRTKHIALRYFLARELQQRGQLRLAYVASHANTTDIFTKALQPCDHQRFCTML
ncbi:unnamed protein product, partial [Closterium sp. NIES-54]